MQYFVTVVTDIVTSKLSSLNSHPHFHVPCHRQAASRDAPDHITQVHIEHLGKMRT